MQPLHELGELVAHLNKITIAAKQATQVQTAIRRRCNGETPHVQAVGGSGARDTQHNTEQTKTHTERDLPRKAQREAGKYHDNGNATCTTRTAEMTTKAPKHYLDLVDLGDGHDTPEGAADEVVGSFHFSAHLLSLHL